MNDPVRGPYGSTGVPAVPPLPAAPAVPPLAGAFAEPPLAGAFAEPPLAGAFAEPPIPDALPPLPPVPPFPPVPQGGRARAACRSDDGSRAAASARRSARARAQGKKGEPPRRKRWAWVLRHVFAADLDTMGSPLGSPEE